MKNRIMLLAIMLTSLLGLAGTSCPAETLNDLAGVTSFLASGNTYLPLQKVANFLGADLSWDIAKSQAVMTYQGKNLVLTPNNVMAVFDQKQVTLPSPPVVVNGRTYVPVAALKKTYAIPIEWDRANSQMKIKGPKGWSSVNVTSRPPWRNGPPPWAPAWGARKKHIANNNSNQAVRRHPGNKYNKAKKYKKDKD